MPVTVPASEPYFMERRGDNPLPQSSLRAEVPYCSQESPYTFQEATGSIPTAPSARLIASILERSTSRHLLCAVSATEL